MNIEISLKKPSAKAVFFLTVYDWKCKTSLVVEMSVNCIVNDNVIQTFNIYHLKNHVVLVISIKAF